jgi:hypothetical protein
MQEVRSQSLPKCRSDLIFSCLPIFGLFYALREGVYPVFTRGFMLPNETLCDSSGKRGNACKSPWKIYLMCVNPRLREREMTSPNIQIGVHVFERTPGPESPGRNLRSNARGCHLDAASVNGGGGSVRFRVS